MKEMQANKIESIYKLLGDDLSKYIFENRLMFSLTSDVKFIRNVVCTIDICREIYERMKSIKEKVGIFGAGIVGRSLVHTYRDIEFECFIDNKRAGTKYERLPVISLSEFKERYSNGIVIISTKLYYKEIMKQLLEEGFPEEQIINIGMEYEKLNHLQYFDLPQLENKRLPEEVFVDGGSYDGNTSIDFIKWNRGKGYTIAWEPDPDNREKCMRLLKENEIGYDLIPKGLWSEDRELKLKSDKTSSRISGEGDIKIEVDSIDNLINRPVTFIKMDIEGSEYQALLGAQNTISKYKPKLAICIYHKPEDIWELPWLIHEINPEYKFYLRHYSFADNETVLYAL